VGDWQNIAVVGKPVAYGIGFVVLVLVAFVGDVAASIVRVAHEGGHMLAALISGEHQQSRALDEDTLARRALDSTILDDAVATQDTVVQLIAAIRRVARLVPGATEVIASRCTGHDYRAGKPAIAWDEQAARAELVDALVGDAHRLLGHLPDQVVLTAGHRGDSPQFTVVLDRIRAPAGTRPAADPPGPGVGRQGLLVGGQPRLPAPPQDLSDHSDQDRPGREPTQQGLRRWAAPGVRSGSLPRPARGRVHPPSCLMQTGTGQPCRRLPLRPCRSRPARLPLKTACLASCVRDRPWAWPLLGPQAGSQTWPRSQQAIPQGGDRGP
jgi:hypothetical protein